MKRYLFILSALWLSLTAMAQGTTVQGVPYNNLSKQKQSVRSTVYPNIDFDDIEYFVGSGSNKAALVVKWDDGKGNDKNLVWGYKWSTSQTHTGEDMLRAIAAADSRFYMLVYGGTSYGTTIGGIGYDLNGNGSICLVKSGTNYSLTNGVYNTTSYDFDSWTSNDSLDHWCSGWYNGYWSYWNASNTSSAYGYASSGASSRTLTNGCVDGWSFMSDMTQWYSNDMSGNVEYVSAPSAKSSARRTKVLARTEGRESATFTVNSLAELRSTIESEEFQDGDIVKFREGLRGTVLENDNPVNGYNLPKSVTIIGNGVIINGGGGFNYSLQSGSITIKDVVFRNLQNLAVYTNECNLTLDGCVFDNIQSDSYIVAFDLSDAGRHDTLSITRCRFSENKVGQSVIYIRSAAGDKTTKNQVDFITSCTFTGNTTGEGTVQIANWPYATFTNNVFENETDTGGNPTLWLKRNNNDANLKVRSGGYNVIEGTVSYGNERLTDTDIVGDELDDILIFDEGEYKVVKDGPAYNHLPSGTVVEDVAWPETDITGLPIDYTQPTHSGACQMVYSNEAINYTKGFFVVNEGWYGHENGHITFVAEDGNLHYRVEQKENPGIELGATNCFGTIFNGKFYVVSKQSKDPGSEIEGGRLSIFDAKTMKVEKQFPVIAANDEGTSIADGRCFLGINEHKGYISTSNGIYPYNIDDQTIGSALGGVAGSETNLYNSQTGMMVLAAGRVFAVNQNSGLMIINAETDILEKILTVGDDWGFGSVVKSKDGNLWCSIAASSGTGQAGDYIVKINPENLDTIHVNMPEGIYGPANSWYAWTADCFSASTQNNVLYWNGGQSSWLSAKKVFKYDIDKNEFSTYLNFDDEQWQIYGSCFRVDPVSDEAVVGLYKNYGSTDYIIRRYDNSGEILAEYTLPAHYWFPSLPVFQEYSSTDPTTTINNTLVVGSQSDGYIYDLTGRRVSGNATHGIYIRNGKKIMVK